MRQDDIINDINSSKIKLKGDKLLSSKFLEEPSSGSKIYSHPSYSLAVILDAFVQLSSI